MKLGLLMESALAHQSLAQTCVDKLGERVRDLDAVVRDEIRRTVVEELREIHLESARAAQTLRKLQRSVGFRFGLVGIAVLLPATLSVLAIEWCALPGRAEIATLIAQRDRLSANVDPLSQHGVRVQWRYCGERRRLCVRVADREPPTS